MSQGTKDVKSGKLSDCGTLERNARYWGSVQFWRKGVMSSLGILTLSW